MVSWTTSCGIPAEGRIFSWEPEKFNLTNNGEMETVISEVASDDLCQRQTEDTDILEIFDNGIGKSPTQGEQYCERLNGQLTMVPTTEEAAFVILKRFNEHIRKKNLTEDWHYFSTWLSETWRAQSLWRRRLDTTCIQKTGNGWQKIQTQMKSLELHLRLCLLAILIRNQHNYALFVVIYRQQEHFCHLRKFTHLASPVQKLNPTVSMFLLLVPIHVQ